MVPALADGQYVLCEPEASFEVGDVVVAKHPSQTIEIVKRVASIDPAGLVELASDNEAVGTDSRSFGRIDVDDVIGTVTISLEWPMTVVVSR